MKTDNYLKFILTVIAIALVALVVQNMHLIGNAHASANGSNSYAIVPVNPDGTISVRLKSPMEVMDVNIKQVGGSSIYDAMPVTPKSGTFNINLKELGGQTVYDGIPVFSKGRAIDINIEQVAGFKIYGKVPVENQ
jgi:hypothetical protein